MIGTLWRRSPRELRERLWQAAWNRADQAGLLGGPSAPMSPAPEPRTPWPAPDAAEIGARLQPGEREALIARADAIVAGRFDVLGLRGLSYGTPVDWQRDPLSGRSAALEHWTRVPYLEFDRVGDHKLTWEVNRHQWFIQLAQAWLLTRYARYPDTAARLLDAWLVANPPKLGINWCSALELAFRVQSWIHGLRLFGAVPALTPALRSRVLESVEVHARHIEWNLSTWFSPNTHLTGEALALLSVGCAWPDLPASGRWRDRGWTILREVLPTHFHADGVYFEHASWYQAYSVDFAVLATVWARQCGIAVPAPLLDCVARGARALLSVMRPDGTIARLGDDDGGVTFPFRVAPFGDLSDSLWRAAALLDDSTLLPTQPGGSSALLWLEGVDAWERMHATAARPASRSVAYRDGGWIVMREADERGTGREHCLIVDTKPHGAPLFGHSHAAALAIDLSVHGVSLLVDPGTGAYVGEPRRHFRSTAAHNTVTIDGRDSSEQFAAFKWKRVAPTQLVGFRAGRAAAWVCAFHDGYTRLDDPVRHRRSILRLARHYWLMFDTLEAAGTHDATLTFQAAAGAEIALPVEGSAQIVAGGVTLLLAADPRLGAAIEARVVSPAYALEVPAPAVVLRGRTAGTTTFCTALGAADECGALRVSHEGSVWHVTHARGTDTVAHPGGSALTVGAASFDGDVLVHQQVGARETFVAAGAGVFHLDHLRVSLAADDIRVAHRAADGSWLLES